MSVKSTVPRAQRAHRSTTDGQATGTGGAPRGIGAGAGGNVRSSGLVSPLTTAPESVAVSQRLSLIVREHLEEATASIGNESAHLDAPESGTISELVKHRTATLAR